MGRQLGIVQAINETVEWDEKQCFIDPGTHTLAMVTDILLSRSPLYLVEKHYAEMDVELIFDKGYKSSGKSVLTTAHLAPDKSPATNIAGLSIL